MRRANIIACNAWQYEVLARTIFQQCKSHFTEFHTTLVRNTHELWLERSKPVEQNEIYRYTKRRKKKNVSETYLHACFHCNHHKTLSNHPDISKYLDKRKCH